MKMKKNYTRKVDVINVMGNVLSFLKKKKKLNPIFSVEA